MAFSKQSAFQKPKVVHKKKQQKMSSWKRRGTVISLPTLQEEVVPEQIISNPEVEMVKLHHHKPATEAWERQHAAVDVPLKPTDLVRVVRGDEAGLVAVLVHIDKGDAILRKLCDLEDIAVVDLSALEKVRDGRLGSFDEMLMPLSETSSFPSFSAATLQASPTFSSLPWVPATCSLAAVSPEFSCASTASVGYNTQQGLSLPPSSSAVDDDEDDYKLSYEDADNEEAYDFTPFASFPSPTLPKTRPNTPTTTESSSLEEEDEARRHELSKQIMRLDKELRGFGVSRCY